MMALCVAPASRLDCCGGARVAIRAGIDNKTMFMLKSDIMETPTQTTPPPQPFRVITAYLLNSITTSPLLAFQFG